MWPSPLVCSVRLRLVEDLRWSRRAVTLYNHPDVTVRTTHRHISSGYGKHMYGCTLSVSLPLSVYLLHTLCVSLQENLTVVQGSGYFLVRLQDRKLANITYLEHSNIIQVANTHTLTQTHTHS